MGHGHVIPNPDGSVARCGGPPLCAVCALELRLQHERLTHRPAPAAPLSEPTHKPGDVIELEPLPFMTNRSLEAAVELLSAVCRGGPHAPGSGRFIPRGCTCKWCKARHFVKAFGLKDGPL